MYLYLLSASSLHPFPCPIQYLNPIRKGILSSLFMEYPEHFEQSLEFPVNVLDEQINESPTDNYNK